MPLFMFKITRLCSVKSRDSLCKVFLIIVQLLRIIKTNKAIIAFCDMLGNKSRDPPDKLQ